MQSYKTGRSVLRIHCKSKHDMSGFSEFHRIADKINQNLTQSDRVGGDLVRNFRRHIGKYRNALLSSMRQETADHVLHKILQVNVSRNNLHLAGFYF